MIHSNNYHPHIEPTPEAEDVVKSFGLIITQNGTGNGVLIHVDNGCKPLLPVYGPQEEIKLLAPPTLWYRKTWRELFGKPLHKRTWTELFLFWRK